MLNKVTPEATLRACLERKLALNEQQSKLIREQLAHLKDDNTIDYDAYEAYCLKQMKGNQDANHS